MELTIVSMKHGTHTVYFDDSDYDLISGYMWHLQKVPGSKTLYALTHIRNETGNRSTIRMHKLITGYKQTDHINRNGLDNRRKNLREATSRENQGNVSLLSTNTSGFRGVSWNKRYCKWQGTIEINKRKRFLGYFDSAIEAAKAYNQAASSHFGKFSWLNPIEG